MTTLQKLIEKSKIYSKQRMPSIAEISKLLKGHNIQHDLIPYYVKNKRKLSLYVNEIKLHLDTSSTYYSYNTWHFSQQLVKLIESKNQITK